MADNRKVKKVLKGEPTFEKQLDYSKEEINDTDPIFSSAYHLFMSNLLKERDAAVKEELKESVAEVLEPWHYKLDLIINNQKEQSQDLDYLKTMAKENRGRIESLEGIVDIHNTVLEGHNRVLKSLAINRWIQVVIWITLAISIVTAGVLIFHII